jgi:hypothetical protein
VLSALSCPFDRTFGIGCQTDKKIGALATFGIYLDIAFDVLPYPLKGKVSCCFDITFGMVVETTKIRPRKFIGILRLYYVSCLITGTRSVA